MRMVLVLDLDKRTKVDIASTKLTSQDVAKPFDCAPSSMCEIGKVAPLLILGKTSAYAQTEVEARHHV